MVMKGSGFICPVILHFASEVCCAAAMNVCCLGNRGGKGGGGEGGTVPIKY